MSLTNAFENPDFNTLCSYEHQEKYLKNDTAFSCFFMQNKVIYKDAHGKYYYSTIIDDTQKEFVYFEDLALVKELTPIDDEKLLSLISTLEDRNSIVNHFNFHLMEICYDNAPEFVLYSEELQLFIKLDLDSFNLVDETLIAQLAKRSPRPNTFADPVILKLDGEGQILKCNNFSAEVC